MSHEIGETLESPENYFADDNYGLKQCCLCGKIINEIEMECHLVVNHKFKKKKINFEWETSSEKESAKNDDIKKMKKSKKHSKGVSFREFFRTNKDKKKVLKCSCGKIFKHESKVRHHEDRHKKIKRFFCEYCSMGFLDGTSLRRHIPVHTGERPYACNDCDKKFKQLGHFAAHQRVHTGETPLECAKCDKKFKFYATRDNHKCSPVLTSN